MSAIDSVEVLDFRHDVIVEEDSVTVDLMVEETVIHVEPSGLPASEAYTDSKVLSTANYVSANISAGFSRVNSVMTSANSMVASTQLSANSMMSLNYSTNVSQIDSAATSLNTHLQMDFDTMIDEVDVHIDEGVNPVKFQVYGD
jgi:hypothetical protein